MAEKKKVTKKDQLSIWWRMAFLQGSWNYERMQNLGFMYTIAPAIRRLYDKKEDRAAAIKRHMEFFNTHPYVAAPIFGVVTAMEEEKANGADIDDKAINGVKVGMMGPVAGVGDPIFWGTLRPVLGAFAAAMAMSGSILGPILFFVFWNVIRMAFLWFTQMIGYRAGTEITKDLSGGLLQKVTYGASILGMFIMGVLVPRWTTMHFPLVVSKVKVDSQIVDEAQKQASNLLSTTVGDGTAHEKLQALTSLKDLLTNFPGFAKITTLQSILDSLIPGLMPLLLMFFTMFLLKKNVKPLWIILGYFVLGVAGYAIGILGK